MKLKINMVKVDGMNNFDMWRCEVIDALTASNLKDSFLYDKKSEEISEKDGRRQTGRRVISSDLV